MIRSIVAEEKRKVEIDIKSDILTGGCRPGGEH